MAFLPILRQQGYKLVVDSMFYASFLQQIEDGTCMFRPALPVDGITRWHAVAVMFKTEYPAARRFFATVMCHSQLVERCGEKFKIQHVWEFEFESEVKLVQPEVPPFTLHPSKIEWRNPLQGNLFGAFDFLTNWKDYFKYRNMFPTAKILLNCGPHTYECEVRREGMLKRPGVIAQIEFWCPAERKAMVVYLLF